MKKTLSLIMILSLMLSLVSVTGISAEEYYDDVASWTITASCFQQWNEIDKAFDGNEKTYWHSEYSKDGVSTKHENPHMITVTFPEAREISGVTYVPRPKTEKDTSEAGIWQIVEVYTSEDGVKFTYNTKFIYETTKVAQARETATATLATGGTFKAIRFKVSGVNGHGSGAEIKFIKSGAKNTDNVGSVKGDGKVDTYSHDKTVETKEDVKEEEKAEESLFITPSSSWKAEASSVREGYEPHKVIDGNDATYWHSNYVAEGSSIVSRDSAPYNIDIIFGEDVTFSGFMYQARGDGKSGICTEYETYASDSVDGEWYFLEKGTMNTAFSTLIPASKSEKTYVGNITAKKFRFVILNGGNGYGTCAELKLFKAKDGAETVKASGYEELYDRKGLSEISVKEAIATSNKTPYVNGPLKNALDGRVETWWQTESAAKPPYTLNINLASVQEIAAIDVYPRQTNDFHGIWEEFSIYYSLDGENYELALEGLGFEQNLDTKRIVLDTPVKAQYIEFEITKGYTNKASVGELKFYETVATMKKRTGGNNEKYVLKIDSPVISAVKEGVAEEKTLDVAPYIAGGSTLIPLRGLLEMMGAEITWIDEDQTIKIKKDGVTIILQNRHNLVFVETGGKYGTVRYTLPQSPRIKDGRTFIPIRFISEHLGYNVEWNGDTREVTITK